MKLQFPLFLCAALFLPIGVSAATSLSVPFSSQAPGGVWIEPWQNACEETVTVMIDHFYKGQSLTKERAEQSILSLYHTKTNTYGWSLDENADQIVEWINNFYPWEAQVVVNPSIEDLEDELDEGHPIIVPIYAPYLNNPHFSSFFTYHTIVLSGYDNRTRMFTAQEPGTQYGENYQYSYNTILQAMHDFVPGRTRTSRQVAIFTNPEITKRTAFSDGDNDGLLKQDELVHGTSLMKADTDELSVVDGALIKSVHNPKVYIVHGKEKRHISTEAVFLRNGWQWGEIQIVTNAFLIYLETGDPVI